MLKENSVKKGEVVKKTEGENKCDFEPFKPMGAVGKFLSVLILLILLAISYWYLSYKWEVYVESNKIESYLETKYGKGFKVIESNIGARGYGLPREVEAKVYPTDDQSMVFIVNANVEGKSRNYFEYYLTAIWSKEAQKEVQAYFNLHSIDVGKVDVVVTVDNKIYNKINEVLALSEALVKYKKNIQYNIYVNVNGQFNNEMKLEYAKQVMQIIGFLKENEEIENPEINYDINVEYKDGKFKKYGICLLSKQIKEIKSVEELIPLFK